MKKITFLLLLIPVFGWSQNVWFDGLSKDSALLMAKTITGMAKHKFSFYKVTNEAVKNGDGHMYRFIIDSTKGTAKPEYVDIGFQMIYIGEVPRYFFKGIPHISLLDIYPFWKNFVDVKADIATIKGDQDKVIFKEKNSASQTAFLYQGDYGYYQFKVN